MCGFVGFVNNIADYEKIMNQMLERIHHRGPDDRNTYMDDQIALGFTRLSFLDLEGGGQPIFNEDQSMVLVFNGEIYNYETIRTELLNKGHRFYTETDSEVLIHGYEEYGPELLQKLRGMFAFVIYDKKQNKLFGARDHFGIKPLYYYHHQETLIFGSEIKSFLEHPAFVKEFNHEVLSDYLSFGFNPNAETMFKGVFKLPAGSYFEFADQTFKITKYHQFEFVADERKSFEDHVQSIEAIMTDSVKHHNISDPQVEVGSFLSSGIDSSYIVKEAAAIRKLKTFSVGYQDERYSELPDIKKFVKEVDAEIYTKEISPEEYFAIVPKAIYHLDEPIADAAAISLYFVANEARKRVKAALSGEGADELFAGYNPYKNLIYMERYQKLPQFIRKSIAWLAKKLPSMKGKSFLIRGVLPFEERYFGCGGILLETAEQSKILKDCNWVRKPIDTTRKIVNEVNSQDDVTKAQYLDINLWLANDILLKADKMSMANSLEVRVPFLDKDVWRVASKIPYKYRVNIENTKISLRHAAAKRMNEYTANKKKLGFPVPIRAWIREEKYFQQVRQAFTSELAKQFFNTTEIEKLLVEHKESRADHFKKIWLIYGFLVWYQEYFQSERGKSGYQAKKELVAN